MSKASDFIFDYLLTHSPSSIPEMSRALHLTRADVRHHLNELIEGARVVKIGQIGENRAGRPSSLYQAIPPVNRAWMKTLVMGYHQMLSEHGLKESDITQTLVNDLFTEFHPSGAASARLNQAVAYLTQKGIRMSWVAGPDGPVIHISPDDFLSQEMQKGIIGRIQKEL